MRDRTDFLMDERPVRRDRREVLPMTTRNASDRSESFLATLDHVVHLQRKANRLADQAQDALEALASMSGDVSVRDLLRARDLLQEARVPNRQRIYGKSLQNAVGPVLDPGAVLVRQRDDDAPWPFAAHYVYLLAAAGAVTYIGQTSKIGRRIKQHRRDERPFDEVHIIGCASAAQALELEADLVFQHQPVGNANHLLYRRWRP